MPGFYRPSAEEPDKEFRMAESRTLPVLPLRDIVVFPKMAAPLFVGRENQCARSTK